MVAEYLVVEVGICSQLVLHKLVLAIAAPPVVVDRMYRAGVEPHAFPPYLTRPVLAQPMCIIELSLSLAESRRKKKTKH